MVQITKNIYRAGFTLIEVLITLIIVLIGLLGIAALQGNAQVAELESYQRAQALIMLSEIVDRINANRSTAQCFAITNPTTGTPYIGVGSSVTPSCSASTTVQNDMMEASMTELDNILKGAAEAAGTSLTGSMIGARACISYDGTNLLNGVAGTGPYTVSVAWQGMTSIRVPTDNCAINLYGADDSRRRVVSTTLRLATLWP